MTYEEYWYGDVLAVKTFRKADEFKQERLNVEAWVQGIYFYDALSCSLKNAFKRKNEKAVNYPNKPYELFQKRKTDSDMQKEIEATRNETYRRLKAYTNSRKLKQETKNGIGVEAG